MTSYFIHPLWNLNICCFLFALSFLKSNKLLTYLSCHAEKVVCQFQVSVSNSPDAAKSNRSLATPFSFYFLFSPRGLFFSLFLAAVIHSVQPTRSLLVHHHQPLSASLCPGHMLSLTLRMCLCWKKRHCGCVHVCVLHVTKLGVRNSYPAYFRHYAKTTPSNWW